MEATELRIGNLLVETDPNKKISYFPFTCLKSSLFSLARENHFSTQDRFGLSYVGYTRKP